MRISLQVIDPISKRTLNIADVRKILTFDENKLFNALKTGGWIAIYYAKQVRPPRVRTGELNRGYTVAEYRDKMMVKIGSAKYYWKFQEYGTMRYGLLPDSQTSRKGGIKPKLMAHQGVIQAKDLIANEILKAAEWK